MDLTKETILEFAKRYDNRFKGKSDALGERELEDWFSTHRYLDKKYFMRLGMWKSPRPKKLYESNTEDNIIRITSEALASSDEGYRVTHLQELRGVSWPVASVILYFAFPNEYSILDYRALESLGINKPSSYNLDFWIMYINRIREIASKVGLTVRTVDKALWEYSKEKSIG